MGIRRLLLTFALFLAGLSSARAEHRVALLLQHETDSDLEPVAGIFEEHGFQCRSEAMPDERTLKSLIDEFTASTPTRGTAVIYYRGRTSALKQQDGTLHLGIPYRGAKADRGVSLHDILEKLNTRGGSVQHRLILGPVELPDSTAAVVFPEDVVIQSGDLSPVLKTIVGQRKASSAVSSRDQFPGPGQKAGDEWVDANGLVFVWCPPGKFTMGSPEDTPGRYPDEAQREVEIGDGFWIMKYEMPWGQFLGKNRPRQGVGDHKLHPVNKYHFDDGKSMCRNATAAAQKAGRLPTDWEYAMPTGEQWEYAARAGTPTRYYFGDDLTRLTRHANFADKTWYDTGDIFSNAAHRTLSDGFAGPAPVGGFAPNPWGLHDVYGNVSEWCSNQDARGGAWVSLPENCRSAYRDHYSSRNDQVYLGYRLVIQPVKEGS